MYTSERRLAVQVSAGVAVGDGVSMLGSPPCGAETAPAVAGGTKGVEPVVAPVAVRPSPGDARSRAVAPRTAFPSYPTLPSPCTGAVECACPD
jgi:hypothetical protein